MQIHIKRSLCALLCLVMGLSLSACSNGAEMTDENINDTVALAEKALKEFDTEALKKYVDSQTLGYILNIADAHEQVGELAKLMFENLTLEVKSIDIENQTVTLLVNNKDLSLVGERYARRLKSQFPTTLALINGYSDEGFLDSSMKMLTAQISRAIVPDNPTEVTVSVKKDGKNLKLVFDQTAEDAVSGGALTAIVSTYTAKNNASTDENDG